MGYKRIIICEVCGKEKDLDKPSRDEWFVENISHQICSKECFEKQMENKGVSSEDLDREIISLVNENFNELLG